MQVVTTVGLDIAKSVFQVHGVDAAGQVVIRRQLKRRYVLAFFEKLPACLVGIEACASSHHWSRELKTLGHTVRLMPPAYVKPYVKRQKNDTADAEAICEAVTRANMRFVATKTPVQQSCLTLHRTRHLFIRQQTAVINVIRAHLAEFGIVAPVGRKGIETLLDVVANPTDKRVPVIARACLAALGAQLRRLKEQILEFDRMIMAWHRSNEASKRLDAIPGELIGCLALAFLLALADSAVAEYPERPVTIIVPFAAGGPSDVMARILADRMRLTLKQPVLVENVTGAGGSIGVTRAVRSTPDGYAISFGHLGTHVFNGAIYPLTFNLLIDLEPLAMLPSNPMVIVSKNALPAKTLKEFIAWVKQNSGNVSAGTAGSGSGSHIGGVYFENITGVKLQFVPYRGTGPALNDLMAGQIDIMIDQTSNSINQIRFGKIRAYAVTDQKRVPTADDIPTVDEAGLPGFYMTLWSGMWVPKGTPKAAITKLNAAVVEALADPSVRERFAQLGLEVPPRERQTPEALAAHHKAEIAKWWPIIKDRNIRAD